MGYNMPKTGKNVTHSFMHDTPHYRVTPEGSKVQHLTCLSCELVNSCITLSNRIST